MSLIPDAVLFSVILAVNLLLVGLLVGGSLAVSFRLLKNISPRARYVISLAAFMVIVIVPVTLSVVDSPARIPVAGIRHEGLGDSATGPDDVLTEGAETAPSDTLGAFTVSFANSGAGHIFFLLWVAGALYFTLLEGAGHWNLRASMKTWKPATDSERNELLCPEGVPLYFDEDERPGTVGLFRPAVVLPTGISNGLPLDSVRYIVGHEAAHARWRDPLVNSILRLIRSVFWVCPALWLIERYARAEREAAADHAVVMEFSADGSEFEETAVKYATTLMTAAKQFNSFGLHEYYRPQTTSIGAGPGLEARVRRLLEYSAKPRRGRVASAAIIAALSLAALTAMPLASRPPESGIASPGPDMKTHAPRETEKAEQSRPPALEAGRRRSAEALSRVITSLNSSRKASNGNLRELRALDTRLRNLNGLRAGLSQLKRAQPPNTSQPATDSVTTGARLR